MARRTEPVPPARDAQVEKGVLGALRPRRPGLHALRVSAVWLTLGLPDAAFGAERAAECFVPIYVLAGDRVARETESAEHP
jgi:hypothetical protein